eukprot:scaffold471_cov318-Ochromonas_danica.AAC.19
MAELSSFTLLQFRSDLPFHFHVNEADGRVIAMPSFGSTAENNAEEEKTAAGQVMDSVGVVEEPSIPQSASLAPLDDDAGYGHSAGLSMAPVSAEGDNNMQQQQQQAGGSEVSNNLTMLTSSSSSSSSMMPPESNKNHNIFLDQEEVIDSAQPSQPVTTEDPSPLYVDTNEGDGNYAAEELEEREKEEEVSNSTPSTSLPSPPPLPRHPPPGWKPPPPPMPAQKTKETNEVNPPGSVIKIVVESSELFGHSLKKLLKFALLSSDAITPLKQFEGCLRGNFPELLHYPTLYLLYLDEDVSDFVLLDGNTWSDFVLQKKHHVKISATQKSEVDDEAENEIDPDVSLPPPPPPSYPPPPPTPSSSATAEIGSKNEAGWTVATSSSSLSPERPMEGFDQLVAGLNEEAAGLVRYLLLLQAPSHEKGATAGASSPLPVNDCKSPSARWALVTSLPPLPSSANGRYYEVLRVNGVRLTELTKDFKLALMRQKKRPIVLDLLPLTSTSSKDMLPTSISQVEEEGERMTYALFLSKYNHSAASKLRKQVDKLVEDYHQCDWYRAKMDQTGLPHQTITSLYRYIEAEMMKLELFNPQHKRGSDLVVALTEEEEELLRDYIERYLFDRVHVFTRTLYPIYRQLPEDSEVDVEEEVREMPVVYIDKHFNLIYPSGNGGASQHQDIHTIRLELSPEHDINMKLAFLRFLTLEHLGLGTTGSGGSGSSGHNNNNNKRRTSSSENPPAPSSASRSSWKEMVSKVSFSQILLMHEEWYLIMKACNRAVKAGSPGEILAKFVAILRLVTSVLDGYLHRPHLQLHPLQCSRCGRYHIDGLQPTPTEAAGGDSKDGLTVKEVLDAIIHCPKVEEHSVLPNLYGCLEHGGSEGNGDGEHQQALSADDLLPAIIYMLIQANPNNIELILSLCTHYRHPMRLRGEEAYVLTQLTSALAFLRQARARDFDLPIAIYNTMLMKYKYTLSLLLECKNGHLGNVRHYHSRGADVNALSPDHKDNALTASIRYQHYPILLYLLSLPEMVVDQRVHLFRGAVEGCTPLFVAVESSQLHAVVALLDHGANRYLTDYNHLTVLDFLANRSRAHTPTTSTPPTPVPVSDELMHFVLSADPSRVSLCEAILKGDKKMIIGLLLQERTSYIKQSGMTNGSGSDGGSEENSHLTVLHACLKDCRVDMMKLVLSVYLFRAVITTTSENKGSSGNGGFGGEGLNDLINLPNAYGETPLISCIRLFLHYLCCFHDMEKEVEGEEIKCKDGQYTRLLTKLRGLYQMAAILLRYGANRYLSDQTKQSAVTLVDAIDSLSIRSDNNSYLSPTISRMISHSDEDVTTSSSLVLASSVDKGSVSGDKLNNDLHATLYPTNQKNKKKTSASASSSPQPSPAEHKLSDEVKEVVVDMKALIKFDPFCPYRDSLYPWTISTVGVGGAGRESTMPIYELAGKLNFAAVKALLLQGVDINTRCPETGFTALIAATYKQSPAMVKIILQATCYYHLSDVSFHDDQAKIDHFFQTFPHEHNKRSSLSVQSFLYNQLLSAGGNSSKGHRMIPSARASAASSTNNNNTTIVTEVNTITNDGMTALHYASFNGNVEILSLLLNQSSPWTTAIQRNVKNNNYQTPLDVALAKNHVEAANMIKYDPNKVSICLAAKHGDITVMRALLLQGVSINAIRKHYLSPPAGSSSSSRGTKALLEHDLYTPLLAATAFNQYQCVKYILSMDGVDINITNQIGHTALHYAAFNKNESILLRLLASGASRYLKDKHGMLPIHYALADGSGNGPASMIYVNKGVNRNALNLPLADGPVILSILKHDPHTTFIHDLIRVKDYAAVVAMFKQKVSVNQQRRSPTPPRFPPPRTTTTSSTPAKTTTSGRAFIMGETPLIVAAICNAQDIVQLLLKAPDLEVDLSDEHGWTALFHAAHHGHEEIVLTLLKAKANRAHRDLYQQNGIEIARKAGHDQIAAIIEANPYKVHIHDMCAQGQLLHVIALLKQGCPANYHDERAGRHRQTPLMAAAGGGKVEVVRMLLRLPLALQSLNDQDDIGRTALMRAAAIGALDVTAALLNAGCERTLRDHAGLTAYDHAARHSYSTMFKYSAQTMIR